MAGSKIGGLKTRETNYREHGRDFYKRIGSLGGQKSKGGFFYNRELAVRAGRKGGKLGKRGKTKK